ncbi:GTP 3',8-cyclase MoaA [Sphingosinicella rhizophila]|uniref:GTP 3',8-cyclase n=1 Tax=Sphingosinicella rhizophila TaxID=3050082 RepID=A0ABU3QBV2_9SPHN|nr:GTP 3',8-cyclase MoaA [Sphingosinicella sp. GR2756]MDT9600876.1 GTP 3',8-cyclase MoaA [Sphingosinicella sp. GR2756]
MHNRQSQASDGLIDSFGRHISYVRMSVTDRCDLRCRYCMAEKMEFLPRRDLLSIEEIVALADIFIARGVRRIRLTGGEPLVRRGIIHLVDALGTRIGQGLDEVTLTTNGTQLARFAADLFAGGVRRINVSLDSRDPARFRHITRRGDLTQVLAGIQAAAKAGLAIKINMVGLKGINDDEIEDMLRWCAGEGHGLTLIETMPLGEVEEDRSAYYLPLDAVKRGLEQEYTLVPSLHRSGGPARYFDVTELGVRLGLITPLTENFCAGCNRIRIAATGTVYGCLGHDQKVELREALREGGEAEMKRLLDDLLAGKPRRHDFSIAARAPAVARHMNVTGG